MREDDVLDRLEEWAGLTGWGEGESAYWSVSDYDDQDGRSPDDHRLLDRLIETFLKRHTNRQARSPVRRTSKSTFGPHRNAALYQLAEVAAAEVAAQCAFPTAPYTAARIVAIAAVEPSVAGTQRLSPRRDSSAQRAPRINERRWVAAVS